MHTEWARQTRIAELVPSMVTKLKQLEIHLCCYRRTTCGAYEVKDMVR